MKMNCKRTKEKKKYCSRERIELEEGERKVKEICGSQYEKLRIDEERRGEGEEDEDEELRRRICQK